MPGQLHERQALSDQQGLDGEKERTGIARIEARDDRTQNPLQY